MAGLRRPGSTGYSSGIPALRSPAKKVFSNSVWIFGTPVIWYRSEADGLQENRRFGLK
jgi:hypothetical protein